MKRILILICIVCISLGCTITETKQSGIVYKIDIDKDYNIVAVDSVYSHIEVIPLQTTEECLLAKPSQMIICSDSSFVIMDEINKHIYRFDKEGFFLNKIGQKGKGPGEYIIPKSFFDLKDKKQIVVADIRFQKLIYYSYDGKLIDEKRIKHAFRRLVFNRSENKWWGYAGDARRISRDLEPNQRLKFIQLFSDNEKEKFIYGHKSYGHLLCDAFKCYTEVNELCNFSEPFNNNLYIFDGKDISIKYTFDFGKYNPVSSDVDDYILEDIPPRKWLLEKDKKYITSFKNYIEIGNKIYLSFLHDMKLYSFVINKYDNSVYLLGIRDQHKEYKKIDPLFFPHLAQSKSDCYSIVHAYQFKEIDNGFSIDENDNPIIIKYHFNENN